MYSSNPNDPRGPKVPLSSLTIGDVRRISEQVTDPFAKKRIDAYLKRRGASETAKRRAKRSVQKAARKANRR